jgi:exodeoxyribonuclease VII small subunit
MMAKKKTFEESMKQLEQIVEELEDGDLSLEDALKKFEEGVLLSKFCFQKLDETEKKVSLLLREPNGQFQEIPFVSGEPSAKEED